MAIVLEGDGTITGVTTFTTPLDDIKFDSINVTGIATASTFQAGTGVSMASPRAQNIALFTNNVEGLHLDDAGRVGIGTTNANKAADANNAKVVNAGIITANQYYGNQLTAVGSRVTGVGTFENGLNITGNITNGLNVSAGIATFQAVYGTTLTSTGDVTLPDSIIHSGDTNTKIRFPAADTVTVETGGSERVRVTSAGKVLINSTADSNATMVVKGLATDTHPVIKFKGVDANGYAFLGDEYTTDESQITMGLMHSSAAFLLGWGVKPSNTADDTYLSTQDTYATKHSGVRLDVNGLRFLTNSSSQTVTTDAAVTLTERLRIDPSGRVLIGTTTEGEGSADNLTIADSGNCGITIRSGSSNAGGIYFSDGTSGDAEYRGLIAYNQTSDFLQFFTAATEKLRITTEGYVRIGGNEGNYQTVIIDESNRTTTAETALMLYAKHDGSGSTGEGFGTGIRFWGDRNGDNAEQNMGRIMCIADDNSGTTLSGALVFETAIAGTNTERMRIASNGSVMIGTGAPTEDLHLKKARPVFLVEGTNDTVSGNVANIQVRAPYYRKAGYSISDAGGNEDFWIGRPYGESDASAGVAINMGGTEKITISAGGNVRFATGGGITFADSSTSQVLDDYEEGTWTITLHSGGSSISSDNAKYIKVGRMVYFCGECHSLISSDGNNFEISLPVTTLAGAEATFSIMVNSVNMGTAGKWLTGYIFQNQAKARVYQNEDDASWAPISGNDFGNGTMIFGGVLYAAA